MAPHLPDRQLSFDAELGPSLGAGLGIGVGARTDARSKSQGSRPLRPAELRRLTGPPPKAPRHRQPWTDDEEAWLVRRYREGAETWVIALELGRSTWATATRLYLLREQRHIVCARCGTPIEQTGESGHPRVFCPACTSTMHRAADPVPITCPACLQSFTPYDNDPENLFCSKRCANAAWYERVRAQRDAARRRYGAEGAEVTPAQAAEVRRLRARGASWRYIEANVGVNRPAALALLGLKPSGQVGGDTSPCAADESERTEPSEQ